MANLGPKKNLFLIKNEHFRHRVIFNECGDSTYLPENMRGKSDILWWFHLGLTSTDVPMCPVDIVKGNVVGNEATRGRACAAENDATEKDHEYSHSDIALLLFDPPFLYLANAAP